MPCQSPKNAKVILKDMTEYLTNKNLTEMVNDLSKVLANIHLAEHKLKASVQSKVRGFFSNESIVCLFQ